MRVPLAGSDGVLERVPGSDGVSVPVLLAEALSVAVALCVGVKEPVMECERALVAVPLRVPLLWPPGGRGRTSEGRADARSATGVCACGLAGALCLLAGAGAFSEPRFQPVQDVRVSGPVLAWWAAGACGYVCAGVCVGHRHFTLGLA